MATIIYAGFGVWNSTFDVTDKVKNQYEGGQRRFLADIAVYGDPSPGNRKYLFIIWNSSGALQSGVVGETDREGVNLP